MKDRHERLLHQETKSKSKFVSRLPLSRSSTRACGLIAHLLGTPITHYSASSDLPSRLRVASKAVLVRLAQVVSVEHKANHHS